MCVCVCTRMHVCVCMCVRAHMHVCMSTGAIAPMPVYYAMEVISGTRYISALSSAPPFFPHSAQLHTGHYNPTLTVMVKRPALLFRSWVVLASDLSSQICYPDFHNSP